jgi:hypothetical protein
MNDITKIRNARALKAMGMPLNMPVEERTFAPKGTKLWVAVIRRGRDFLEKTIKYGEDMTPRRYKEWHRAHARLVRAVDTLNEYITELMKWDAFEKLNDFNAVCTQNHLTRMTDPR